MIPFLASGLMLVQAPVAGAPQTASPAAVKEKPKQVCQYIVLSGSRMRQRVCLDKTGELELPMGVDRGAPNSGMLHQAPSGTGELPGQGLNPHGR